MGLVFHLIPHTHWDREWYLPRAAFGVRLIAALDELIDRLEADSGFRSFLLDGQTILIEDYLDARPEQRARVEALVSAGRLGVGPWLVLADEQIPSGESLVRNLLAGAAGSARLGGRVDVLYSPDAFGHPQAWPWLASAFRIRHGVLWRGRAGGRDLFRWAAPDGAEVVVHHLPPPGYEVGAALPAERERLAREWPELRRMLVSRAATDQIAVFVGADHHGPRGDIGALQAALAGLEPDGTVIVSSVGELMAAAAASAGELERLVGELRSSCGHTWALQGVHSTRAPFKRRATKAELWLERIAEPLAALARASGAPDPAPTLRATWRELLECHFHDTIGGCCADPVTAEAETRLTSVTAAAREITRAAVNALAGHDPDLARARPGDASPALFVWNPAARARSGVVVADISFFRRDVFVGPPGTRVPGEGAGYQGFDLRDDSGNVIPVQLLERRRGLERVDAGRHYPDLDEVDVARVAFALPELAGMELRRFSLAPASTARIAPRVTASGRSIRNELLEVALERDGSITMTDRRSGERYPGLLRLEAEADAGDTYTFEPAGAVRRSTAPARFRRFASGPLVAVIEGRWSFAGTGVRLRLILHAGEPFVRCVIDLDNRAPDRRLRARIPVGISGSTALAGTAFGTVRRAIEPSDDCPGETPVRTAPAHRFVAAADSARGLCVMAPGFFEYEWTGGDILFTLLRSVGQLSRGDLSTRPGHAGWVTPTPGAQCRGRDRVEIALAPAGLEELAPPDRLCALWEDAVLPPASSWLRSATGGSTASSCELAGDGLVLSAVKPAEDGDGIILRCWNARDAGVAGSWRIHPFPNGAERCRADEGTGVPLAVDAGGVVSFRAGPDEVVTIRVR